MTLVKKDDFFINALVSSRFFSFFVKKGQKLAKMGDGWGGV